jgi:hypothetical protein
MTEERHGEGAGSSRVDPGTGNVVAVCFWDGCDEPAPIADELALIPHDSNVARPPVKLPLCTKHRREWRQTGKLRLFTHPDNLLDM